MYLDEKHTGDTDDVGCSTYLFCIAQRVLRTTFMQKSKLKYACLPSKIVEVWIDWFCIRYDWWRRLQPTSSVTPVWEGKGVIYHQFIYHLDGLEQERRNSSVLAIELRLSCTNPLIWGGPRAAFTGCGQVTPCDIIELRQHWFSHQLGAKLSPDLVLIYCQLDHREQNSVNVEWKCNSFEWRNCIWTLLCIGSGYGLVTPYDDTDLFQHWLR